MPAPNQQSFQQPLSRLAVASASLPPANARTHARTHACTHAQARTHARTNARTSIAATPIFGTTDKSRSSCNTCNACASAKGSFSRRLGVRLCSIQCGYQRICAFSHESVSINCSPRICCYCCCCCCRYHYYEERGWPVGSWLSGVVSVALRQKTVPPHRRVHSLLPLRLFWRPPRSRAACATWAPALQSPAQKHPATPPRARNCR
jgi:hypothetical protein